MSGLLDFIQNPLAAAAVGLLQPTPSGAFGPALANAYQGMNAQQRNNDLSMLAASQQAMRVQQLKAMEEQKKREDWARKQMPGLLGTKATNAPFTPDMFPGETAGNLSGQQTGGLLEQQPATGMFATNPQMAGLLAEMGQINPMATMQAMVTPTLTAAARGAQSTMGKIIEDYKQGRITERERDQAIAIAMKPMIQMAPSAPAGFVYKNPNDPTQGLERVPGAEYNQNQMKSAGFADRMTKAGESMETLVNERRDPRTGKMVKDFDPASGWEHTKAWTPIIGNYLASSEYQQYRQAQEDWVRAKLRLESGAVIGAEEMEREISMYFPQPGDTAATIEAKRKSRETAFNNLVKESQGAYQEFYSPDKGEDDTGKTGKIDRSGYRVKRP